MLLRTSGADSTLRDKNHLRFSVGAFLPIVGEASSSSNVLPWCISVLLGKRGGLDLGEWVGRKRAQPGIRAWRWGPLVPCRTWLNV